MKEMESTDTLFRINKDSYIVKGQPIFSYYLLRIM